MPNTSVVIKGTKDGLSIALDPAVPLGDAANELTGRLTEALSFFHGARVVLDVGPRAMSESDWQRLQGVLSRSQIVLHSVVAEDEASRQAARAAGLHAAPPPARARPAQSRGAHAEVHTVGILIRRTLRSGAAERHTGHVVVLGDLNPGAEVVAGGDVVVWGSLRGVVHAGCMGDQEAVVCALYLAPTQLRLAGLVARPPDRGEGRPLGPEMARIRDGAIVVEAWDRAKR